MPRPSGQGLFTIPPHIAPVNALSPAAIARIRTFAFAGIEAVPVEVQVQISGGLPAFLVVGLPDKAVGEARERVRAALAAMGLSLPPRRVLINLAPADLLKEGSHFDLPLALGVLAAMDILPRDEIDGYAALGELHLDGTLHPVAGVLPAAIGASARDLGLICPAAQGGEAAWAGRIEVLAAPDLLSLINHFRGSQVLTPPQPAGVAETPRGPELADVKGMETAKRALEIAAAGSHNLLLIGPPGAGKSMLAARLPGLLPDLTPAQALEVSMIHSVAGLLEGGRLVMRPPFREPHHSASQAALSGGGQRARPGEVSPGPSRRAVPGRTAGISQAGAGIAAPADGIRPHHGRARRRPRHLSGALPAGRGDEPVPLRLSGRCRSGNADARHAAARITRTGSADRCSTASTSRSSAAGLRRRAGAGAAGETSAAVAARVARARMAQAARSHGNGPISNAELDPGDLALTPDAQALAEQAMDRLRLSPRGYTRVLRVSRSIADLAGAAVIGRVHVAEALAFRHRMPGRKLLAAH